MNAGIRPAAQRSLHALLLALAAQSSLALEPDEVFEKVSPSVWGVLTMDQKSAPLSLGSAVVVGPGSLVTNCHVIDKAKAVWVRRENVMYGAEIELRDSGRDLCRLKVANFTAPAVTIAELDAVRVGGKAYAIGNPRGLENTLSDGLVSGLRKGKEGGVEAIQTTAPISPGSSGGGLFDVQGRLVGITTFSLRDSQALNFAVPAAWIRELGQRASAASTGPAAAVALAGSSGRRPGDAYEYVLTELMTGLKRSVQYRVERIEHDRILFNQGERIETLDGGIVKVGPSVGGEFDVATPPGGWARTAATPAERWKVSYASSSANVRYELTGRVLGQETVRVPAGEFVTTLYRYAGYVNRNGARGTFDAAVWYCDELKRAVRFEVNSRANYQLVRERLELSRLPE